MSQTIGGGAASRLGDMSAAMLHQFCAGIGVGKTVKGTERHLSPEELATVLLCSALTKRGCPRAVAFAAGRAILASDEWTNVVANEDARHLAVVGWRPGELVELASVPADDLPDHFAKLIEHHGDTLRFDAIFMAPFARAALAHSLKESRDARQIG